MEDSMKQSNYKSISSTNKPLWRVKDVSAYMGVSKGHIYNLTSKNLIPFIKKGKALYFIPELIEDWIIKGNY